MPLSLPEPPATWDKPYASITGEVAGLQETNLRQGQALAVQFWDPFLANDTTGRVWHPDQRRWN